MPSVVTWMDMLLERICRQTLPPEMYAIWPFATIAGVGTRVGGTAVDVGGTPVAVGIISSVFVGGGSIGVVTSGASVAVELVF